MAAPRNQPLAQQLMARYSSLVRIREDYKALWQDIIDFVNIRRYNLDDTLQRGAKAGTKLYSSEATDALRDLRSGLFGYLVSPAMQWFKLRIGNELLMTNKQVREWLEAVEWSIYTALQKSNFYETVPEIFNDGGSIGTATLYDEEDLGNGALVFTACNPGEIWIAEDRYGRVDTVYRRTKFTARQAVEMFGKGEDSGLSQGLLMASQQPGSAETEFTFYHCVMPNRDVKMFYNPITGLEEPTIAPTNKPWLSYYVQLDGQSVVSESGYWSNPFQVWRWRKNSEEIYGRSPASDAIVDILTDNQMSKTLLNAAHLHVEPPVNAPAELKGKLRMTPRGVNYYEETGRTVSSVLGHGANYPIGVDREERVKKAIQRHFMTEFFTLLSKAALEGVQISVPQVMEMQGEKAIMVGDIVGQLNSELLDPLMDRVFQLEYAAGRIPPPPDILAQFEGTRIDVHYMGPLAQAQRQMFKVQGITRGLSITEAIIAQHPEVSDNIDYDIVTRDILEATGFPAKALRDERDVAATRKMKGQQMMAQQQAMMALQATQAIPNLSKKPEEGSPMSELAGGKNA